MTVALEVCNLHYRYPHGAHALRGISFQLQAGECVGLIGPNGAGKSTLLLHLNGLLPEHLNGDAAVRVGEMPVAAENLVAIRRRVGMVFQDPNDQLFCPTVAEDIAFGPRQLGLSAANVSQKVNESLVQVGLSDLSNRPCHHLSFGEKRRACIAGVLACDPGILVLDEPTSSLDPRARRELQALLRALPQTRLIATHDLDFIRGLCDRTLILDEGLLVADGATRMLLSDDQLMLKHGLR